MHTYWISVIIFVCCNFCGCWFSAFFSRRQHFSRHKNYNRAKINVHKVFTANVIVYIISPSVFKVHSIIIKISAFCQKYAFISSCIINTVSNDWYWIIICLWLILNVLKFFFIVFVSIFTDSWSPDLHQDDLWIGMSVVI